MTGATSGEPSQSVRLMRDRRVMGTLLGVGGLILAAHRTNVSQEFWSQRIREQPLLGRALAIRKAA